MQTATDTTMMQSDARRVNRYALARLHNSVWTRADAIRWISKESQTLARIYGVPVSDFLIIASKGL